MALLVAAFFSSACPPPGEGNNGNTDAGDVEQASFDVRLGKSDQGTYTEFSSTPQLEVVAGFQGGFHVEPALKVEQLQPDEFFAVVSYRIEDVNTGETIHRSPAMYRVDEGAFEQSGEAWLRNYDRVILEVNTAGEAAGRTVDVFVEVEIEGMGTAGASQTVELVDEIDEIGG
ncbi:MAG: hypothetical protein ACQEVA_02675 [Myxococcota bacterium]